MSGPLNISVKGEYALLAVLDLALQKPGEPVKIGGIARRRGIPRKFLELILASLKQGGFLESRRGAEGGYLLARHPSAITVGEILRHVEGARADSSATRTHSPFADMWKDVEDAISGILDSLTFAEVARRHLESQSVYVPNWDI